MNFFKSKEVKNEESELENSTLESIETKEGTKILEEQEKMLQGTDPETIAKVAEKNPVFKEKLKTVLGVVGILAGASSVSYAFANAEEMNAVLREVMVLGGLGFSITSAMISDIKEKVLNINVPDSWAK
ncbi:MAG: hypothetical protein PHT84_00420 [Candidatus Pacebacteria bacterium]|nr:hypothetical protein [Candidatus Paceibacterota bacterium]